MSAPCLSCTGFTRRRCQETDTYSLATWHLKQILIYIDIILVAWLEFSSQDCLLLLDTEADIKFCKWIIPYTALHTSPPITTLWPLQDDYLKDPSPPTFLYTFFCPSSFALESPIYCSHVCSLSKTIDRDSQIVLFMFSL